MHRPRACPGVRALAGFVPCCKRDPGCRFAMLRAQEAADISEVGFGGRTGFIELALEAQRADGADRRHRWSGDGAVPRVAAGGGQGPCSGAHPVCRRRLGLRRALLPTLESPASGSRARCCPSVRRLNLEGSAWAAASTRPGNRFAIRPTGSTVRNLRAGLLLCSCLPRASSSRAGRTEGLLCQATVFCST